MADRRQWMLAGAGGLAAAAGVGLAWRRWGGDAAGLGAAGTALWSTEFDTPSGQRLAMKSLQGRPLLLNFWATWCPPCIEEFPLIDSFFRQNMANGWQVLGLAIDQPSAVRGFLQKYPVSFPIALAGLDGTELGRSLGNSTGGLPFSVALGAGGKVLERKMGKLQPADLARLAALR